MALRIRSNDPKEINEALEDLGNRIANIQKKIGREGISDGPFPAKGSSNQANAEWSSSFWAKLRNYIGNGLEWFNNKIRVKPHVNQGIEVSHNGVATKRKPDYGIDCDASGLLLKIKASEGLLVGADGVATKRKTGGGVDCDADGLFVTVTAPVQEAVEDVVGAMVTGNTETGISVTYDDTGGKLDFDAQTAGDIRYIKHDLATAANDFLAASGLGAFVKKTLAETLTILGKAAASGLASLDASSILVQAVKLLNAATGALATTDGAVQWQSTRKIGLVYDTQRERAISEIGWLPYAYQIGGGPGDVVTTAFALTANYDVIAVPVVLEAPMLLESVTIRQTDVATARSWRFILYEQYLNDGNAAENTLTLVAACNATAFTPTAASNETAAPLNVPRYLPPGIYWLVIQNRHATNALNLGTMAAGTMALNTAQTKPLGALAGSTLDFVAAAWTKQTMIVGARLNGRVFGETTSF